MPAAITYLRVSSQMQAMKGNPIAAQKEACLEYAKRLGYEVDQLSGIYVDDGISGRSTDDRLAYKQMMERLRTDPTVQAVIAYDISRIFRNVVEYLKFKEQIDGYGKQFLSVSENFIEDTPAGWFSETMMSVFAEFRSRQDAEKIRLGMRHKAESGIFPAKAPFGYKNVQEKIAGDKDRRWMATNEKEAAWVKEAFQKYATGNYSLWTLLDEFKARGFPTRLGRPLCMTKLEEILKCKLYIGHISWGGVENPNGKHEKLVDDETFYKVQTLLLARNYGSDKRRKFTFLLRGIAYCGECGSRITAAKHKGRGGKLYPYYSCHKRLGTKRITCTQPTFPLEEAERQFEQILKSIQISKRSAERLRERIEKMAQKRQGNNQELRDSLAGTIETLSLRKKSLTEKYIDGDIDKESYLAHKGEIETKEVQSKAELDRIDGKLSSWKETTQKAIELAQHCYKTYKAADHAQKILLVRSIFDRVTIQDRKIMEVKLKEPFELIRMRIFR